MSRNKLMYLLLTLLIILSIVLIKIKLLNNSETFQPDVENDETSSQQPRLKDESPTDQKTVRCPADVKKCTDGSYVGRIPPNCAFALCQAPMQTQ